MRLYLNVVLLCLSCSPVCSAAEPTLAELLVGGEWDEEYITSTNRSTRGKWHYVFSEGGSFVASRDDWTVDKLDRKNLVTSEYKGKWTVETRRLSRQELKASGVKSPKPIPVLTIRFENNKAQHPFEGLGLDPNGTFVAVGNSAASTKSRIVFITITCTDLVFYSHRNEFPERPLILIHP
ncbi:MAG: hypothetical protein L0211_14100 [Planctomycetaceae bacterium]|nr:hypothetical protein [Planctomycetaceae bacterium]